tara:strand:- start:1493 stop:1789 length:297 start_codon:yes stop_codon:yes gene_type:complete
MGQMQTVGKTATTIAANDSGETVVTYHATQVVKFSGERIVLNTGGWKTVTTKARMNQAANQFALGYTVFQKNHAWFVSFGGADLPFDGESITLEIIAA